MGYQMPLAFLAAGIVLIVLEMATLTFYMAALGFAALVTSAYTWVFPSTDWQAAVVFAIASMVAMPLAHVLRHRMQRANPDKLTNMDKGGLVTVAEIKGDAVRVKYRDSLWEAVWEGAGRPEVGQRAEITSRDDMRLHIKAITH
ncbi:MAG: NfeD family protein [Gammaproteobacteria bacterium]